VGTLLLSLEIAMKKTRLEKERTQSMKPAKPWYFTHA
jgi:hypothetical protein